MLILIILIPVLAAVAVLSFPRKASPSIVIGAAAAALILSVYVLFQITNGSTIINEAGGLPGMPFLFEAGKFTTVILTAVTAVALFIFIYAAGYMKMEPGKIAFWSGMSLFLAAMEVLVLSGDWVSFIIGWEIMAFASWRLIATWHPKQEARYGAAKAFMVTRITDMGLYVGIFMIILQTGTSAIDPQATTISAFAAAALLFAVMGKSAQVPFQSWLSGAMAGPTPVSSFLHSATLVAGGIILMLKAFPLLPEIILPWIGAVGGITIILAGLTALFSKDLKQMLAASTSSHLGFMLLAIGAGYPGAAVAHLLAHAFMKSSLFLGAGIWQHAYDSTEFSKIKSGGKDFKMTYVLFAIAAIALSGIPPLIGYYSKDAILAAGLKTGASYMYFSTAAAGALFTALYMGRSLKLLYGKNTKETEQPKWLNFMRTGLLLLVLVIIAGGFFLKPVVKFMHFEMPHASTAIIAGIIAAVVGLAAGWFLLAKNYKSSVASFIRNNYSIAGGYDRLVVIPVLKTAGFFQLIERGIAFLVDETGKAFYGLAGFIYHIDKAIHLFINWLGKLYLQIGSLTRKSDESGIEEAIEGITEAVKNLGKESRKLQSGLVHRQLMWSVIGFIGFILIVIFINL